MRKPVNNPYKVTLEYGATTAPYSKDNPHNGVDLVSDDRKIVAPEDGTVMYYANTEGKSGWMMVLQGTRRHSFSHTVAGSNKVPVGTKVKEGQHLATMGDTGFATGVHTHWVVDGGTVDPMSLVKESDMLTEQQYNQLKRFYHGLSPSKAQKEKYVGKITSAEMTEKLKASPTYNVRKKQAKNGDLNYKAHLPAELRLNFIGQSIANIKDKIIDFVKGVK